MFALKSVIDSLSKQRPIFHSEADFQHALAWQIRCSHPDAKIYLETPCLSVGEKHAHVDIVFVLGAQKIACEVKYYTACLSTPHEGFHLKNHAAQDCGRYDFLWDLSRIQRMVGTGYAAAAYVVLLTNDTLYWRPPTRKATIDATLRIHEGATVRGTLFWGDKASRGSMHGRDRKIELTRVYTCHWAGYSSLGVGRGDTFRYLLLEVNE
jgi:hypothetical protein